MSRSRFLFTAALFGVGTGFLLLIAGVGGGFRQATAGELQLVTLEESGEPLHSPSFADIAERAIPGVVKIDTRRFETFEAAGDMFDTPSMRRFHRGIPFYDGEEGDSLDLYEMPSTGTGFFITADGYLLTNKHVIERAHEVVIKTWEGKEYLGTVIGKDPDGDLALLKIEVEGTVHALPLGDSRSLRVGEWVLAIGYPLTFDRSVTFGVVSAKSQYVPGANGPLGSFVQTDAAINMGNSGGPLLNARGEVIGINTAIMRRRSSLQLSSAEGIGLAIPVTPVKKVLNQLLQTGTVQRGYLGVVVRPADALVAEYAGLGPVRGALVESVEEGHPAAEAGIVPGDIVRSVNGIPVETSDELVQEVAMVPPGERVKISLWRDGKEVQRTVVLAKRPAPSSEVVLPAVPDSAHVAFPGFVVEEVDDAMRRTLESQGVQARLRITKVDPTSDAARRGVSANSLLTEVNGVRIDGIASFRSAIRSIESGSVVRLRLIRILETPTETYFDRGFVFFRAPARKKKS